MSFLGDGEPTQSGQTDSSTVKEPQGQRSVRPVSHRCANVALTFVGVLLGFSFLWKAIVLHWNYPFFDFPSFYYGAWSTFRDHVTPYNYDHLQKYYRLQGGDIFPYVYPPFSIFLFYPLQLVSYEVASKALLIFNCLSPLVLCWFLFRRILRNVHPVLYYGGMVLFLFSAPTNITIEAGQINLLVLSLLLLFWHFLGSVPGCWRCSVMLTLAIALKTYPMIFLAYLLKIRRYQVVFATVTMLGLLCIFSLYILPANTWSVWHQEVLPSGGYGSVPTHLFPPDHPQNQSLNGMLYRLFGGRKIGTFLTYACVGLLFLIVLVTPSKREDKKAILDLDVTLFLLLLQLAAPYSWQHHLVFSLIALMTGIHYALTYRFIGVALMLSLSAILIASDYPLDHPWLQSNSLLALLIYVKLYSVIISVGAVCWLKANAHRAQNLEG